MLYGNKVFGVHGVFYDLMLQDVRIEVLTKLQYFIGAFTSHGCKSSKAMPSCSCSSLTASVCVVTPLISLLEVVPRSG